MLKQPIHDHQLMNYLKGTSILLDTARSHTCYSINMTRDLKLNFISGTSDL